MNMKSKELKTYNLPNNSDILSEINAKPNWVFVLLILLGLISFAFKSNIYGVSLLTVSILCICFMPRVTLMEFYYDFLVMYNRADKSKCVIIYYNEVSCWYYTKSVKRDYLIIELENGSVEKIEGFSKTIFESYMSRYLKDKHKKISK